VPTRVDLHVKVLDEAVADRAKARGIDALVYAPHFERLPAVRERAARFSDDELLVVPGREVFTGTWRDRRHVLAVDPDRPVPDFLTVEGAMDELAGQDAAVLVPHPGFLNVSLDAADVRRYRGELDAVETYNTKQRVVEAPPPEVTDDLDLPAFGSSYAHLPGTVGEAWTEFETDVETASDLVAALRNGAPRRVCHRRGPGHRARCLAEFAHLGWENSWGKIERVLLSGMEPTHPRHVAYDGAFDDEAVY
jgi:predicted metal-dependent phosphoesterase TrpH